jgi:hypothetical protein
MTTQTETCRHNPSHQFVVTGDDLAFYDRVSPVIGGKKLLVPSPTLCPDCRQQNRLAFRNERRLYHRNCALSGKPVISMYSPDKPFVVYGVQEWWSDGWEALSFGREFDFARPFFPQFQELMLRVPRIALVIVNVENSDYCNYTGDLKNCYLCFGSIFAEDCYYGSPYYSRNCVDVLVTRDADFCYECVDCEKVYECFFCQDCYSSSHLLFCYDCLGCQDCICCTTLRNKRYCLDNMQLSRTEYQKRKSELILSQKMLAGMRAQFEQHKQAAIRRAAIQQSCENCSGSYLSECKNVHDSFFVRRGEDCKFLRQTIDVKDCYDTNYMEEAELVYNSFGAYHEYQVLFSSTIYKSSSMLYCDFCVNDCRHCFGCIGLKKKQYCILNKQYTQDDYERLVPQIVGHMQAHGEWGEYFPFPLSPYAYNETVAQEYFPLSRDNALLLGADWKDEELNAAQRSGETTLPETIGEVDDEITNEVLLCGDCAKHYRIIRPELDFYRRMGLPLPMHCPDCRHYQRLSLRNPCRLWQRSCSKCGLLMQTSYAPAQPETVYCEKCYRRDVV